MSDWQKGDLALCVARGTKTDNPTRPGQIYTVRSVFEHHMGLGLRFDGFPDVWGGSVVGFKASRFRKVTPPKADVFDREVIDLMAGKKVPA